MKKLLAKCFLNEKGEISFRKSAATIGGVGAFLLSGAIPGAQVVIVGKALASIAASLLVIGQVDKDGRKDVKK